jgi:hypothetical protein
MDGAQSSAMHKIIANKFDINHKIDDSSNMTEELETFMTEELGIIDRLGFEPLEGAELFVDVGNNVWNLDQIIHAFNNQ